jgi:hypothetical protein
MHTAARGSKKIAIFHIVPTFSRSAAVICSVRAAVGNGDARYQVSIIGAKQKPTATVFAFPTAKVHDASVVLPVEKIDLRLHR